MAPLGIVRAGWQLRRKRRRKREDAKVEEEEEVGEEEKVEEASASRNEVPKSPQSGRERSIIAKVRASLSYLFHRSREGDSDLRCVRNTHKYTRYREKMVRRGCGRAEQRR